MICLFNYFLKKEKVIIVFFLFSSLFSIGQSRPLIYFSQVHNNNNIALENKNSVVVGLINNDTILDIAMSGSSSLIVGYGYYDHEKLKFDIQPLKYYSERQYLYNIKLIDIDNDGDNDIIANMHQVQPYDEQYKKYIFYNKNNVIQDSFISHLPTPYPPLATIFSLGDHNNDEYCDAYYFDSDSLKVYFFDGKSNELVESNVRTPIYPIVDLNNDGLRDFIHDRILYINRGGFMFDHYETDAKLVNSTFGDFDNDGIKDEVSYFDHIYKFRTNIISNNKTITSFFTNPNNSYENSIDIIDLNQDGYDDLLVAGIDTIYYCKNLQDMNFEVYSFPLSVILPFSKVKDSNWKHGEFTSLTKQFSLKYKLSFSDSLGFHAKHISKIFYTPFAMLKPTYNYKSFTLDINKNDSLELVVLQNTDLLSAELNDSEFINYKTLSFDPYYYSLKIHSIDLDLDGNKDLIYSDIYDPISLSYGLGNGNFSNRILLTDYYPNYYHNIKTADMDNNGYPDILISGSWGFSIFFNKNGVDFEEKIISNIAGLNWYLSDLNNDKYIDLIIPNKYYSNAKTSILINNKDKTFTKAFSFHGAIPDTKGVRNNYTYAHTNSFKLLNINIKENKVDVIEKFAFNRNIDSRRFYMLDYNGDNIPDLIYNNPNNTIKPDTAFIHFGKSGNKESFIAYPGLLIVGIEDVNGDGKSDVLWRSGSQLYVEISSSSTWNEITKKNRIKKISVFPNPSDSYIKLDLPKNKSFDKYEIWNSSGMIVLSGKLTGNEIDVSFIQKGSYYILINTDTKEFYSSSFIKN